MRSMPVSATIVFDGILKSGEALGEDERVGLARREKPDLDLTIERGRVPPQPPRDGAAGGSRGRPRCRSRRSRRRGAPPRGHRYDASDEVVSYASSVPASASTERAAASASSPVSIPRSVPPSG